MNKYFNRMQVWFRERSSRERIFLFFLGLAMIYVFFTLFFIHPLLKAKKKLSSNLLVLNTEISAKKQELDRIHAAIKDRNFLASLQQSSHLNEKLATLGFQLDHLKPMMSSANDADQMIKNILNIQQVHVTLKYLKNFPPVNFMPNVKNKADIEKILTHDIFQHAFQMGLESDYFNTVEYLKRIEAAGPGIYWDTLDYKVIEYPQAEVTVNFHTLIYQKS